MANTLTLVKKIILPHAAVFQFSCLLSGNYASSGGAIGVPGETLNFNGAANPNKIARPKIPTVMNGSLAALPATVDCEVMNSVGGFSGVVERNAVSPTAANFVLRLFTSGGTEMTAQAYNNSSANLLVEPFQIQITVPLRYN